MKFKKLFSFSDWNQIWRLMISNSDKLIIETRNTNEKEVFFNCIDLFKGKKIFKGLQLDEKFWIGIESIYKDIVYFHEFAKPNMPEHKKIIAFDLNKKEVIWKNDELTFLSVIDNKIYCFRNKFEGQHIYSLDYMTGEEIEDLGDNAKLMNDIILTAQSKDDYSDYKYPEILDENYDSEIQEFFRNELDDISIAIESAGLLYQNYQPKGRSQINTDKEEIDFQGKALKDIDYIIQNSNRSTKKKRFLDHIREMFYTFYLHR